MQSFPGLERWSRRVYLPAAGINMHIYDTGAGAQTPVLFLHGLGDEADTWRHVLPRTGAGRRAVAPDLPGFGRSDLPGRRLTIPYFAGIVVELLDQLAIQQAVLVGHSTGAIIAHQVALEHPSRVEKLVLIGGSLASTGQPLNLGLLLFLVPGLGEWQYNRLRKDPQAAYRTLEPYYHRLEDMPAEDREFLFRRVNERVWSDSQRKGFFSTLRGLAAWLPRQQKNLPDRLANWRIPTTLAWGEHDRINSIDAARALLQWIPTARLTVVSGAGHNVQQEQPRAVLAAIDAS